MLAIEIPEVLELTIAPGARNACAFSSKARLMFRSSVTASMIQSQSLIQARLSSKFPTAIIRAASGTKNAAGRDLSAVSRPARARRLRTWRWSSVRPLACSSGVGSRGTISSRSAGIEALAKWAAMRAPIVPAPSTATFLISRKISPQDQWKMDSLRIMGEGLKAGQAQRSRPPGADLFAAPISTLRKHSRATWTMAGWYDRLSYHEHGKSWCHPGKENLAGGRSLGQGRSLPQPQPGYPSCARPDG